MNLNIKNLKLADELIAKIKRFNVPYDQEVESKIVFYVYKHFNRPKVRADGRKIGNVERVSKEGTIKIILKNSKDINCIMNKKYKITMGK